jgi:meso-butanediol dehydrogenase / (S,S)-butanediol dehydrogenase / diacetyl reductase
MFDIAADRKALITGGASGFGFAVAERLVAAGANVAIADVREPAVADAAARLGSAVPIVMDVTDRNAVVAGVARAADVLGGLDTLVTSAGVFEFRAFEDISEREWDWMLDVNLKGVFLSCQAAMPYLRASGRGRIVNVSSDAGKKGYALISTYVASKFGVVGLTESLAAEFGPFGVTVNAVCPSTVAETGMGQKVLEQKVQLFGKPADRVLADGASSYPLRRLGTVADVADAILFLVSDSASWISGESINIDGGNLSG